MMVINTSSPIFAGFPNTGGISSRLAFFTSFGVSLDLPTGGHWSLEPPIKCFIYLVNNQTFFQIGELDPHSVTIYRF